MGDKAPDGSQLRPFVIYFDEDIDSSLWRQAVKATREADWFVVVGSTMLVYPAAALLSEISDTCQLVVIGPEMISLPEDCHHGFTYIPEKASKGLLHFMEMLVQNERSKRFLENYLRYGRTTPGVD